MSKFIIQGSRPLMGAVRLGGAKNAGFKQIIASVLGDKKSRILNLSHINDVQVTIETLKEMGVDIKRCGERTVYINSSGINKTEIPQISGKKTRGATLYAAVLLAKKGEAVIPLPGGCVLGVRPVDRHLRAFESLGVKVDCKANNIYLKAEKLKAGKFRFSKKTHTGTEAMIMLACKAEGKTIIENAGQEPEIDDLIFFLNKMGAKIERGSGERIIIQGVKKLGGAIHRVIPDRNEAVSYAVAALATKGDIVVENARKQDLKFFLQELDKIGGGYQVFDFGIRFWYKGPLQAVKIETRPAPGFMTDWQPLWTLLMTQAKGVSKVIERVHNNRFQFAEQLKKMGAKIDFYNPQVDNHQQFYEFDNPGKDKNFHAAKITGPTKLKASELKVTDLRAGASLTIAALIAEGKSTLTNIEHIDRGYENLDGKLKELGAKIKRVD